MLIGCWDFPSAVAADELIASFINIAHYVSSSYELTIDINYLLCYKLALLFSVTM